MNFTKVGQVALREFVATVSTRGFIVGLLLMPTILTIGFAVVPRLLIQRAKPIEGQVVVVDESGRVGADVARALSQEAIAARRAAVPRPLQTSPMILTLVQHPGAFAADRERDWLLDGTAVPKHLAVVVIPSSALTRPDAGHGYGGYRLYVPAKSDLRVENTINDGVRAALVKVRSRERGLDAADVEAMVRVDRPSSITVSPNGERTSNVGFAQSLPFIFTTLMFMGVMIGGQGLMTTTIEEKSSRVVEVMLSAVSPLELMTGKLLGQLAVGLVSIAIYIGLGMMALTSFAMLGLLDMTLIAYLVAYFVVTYLLMGSIMMAIGAAVNEMREAQSLMMPVMLMLVLPWVLAAPIVQNPSSTFATVLSFVPPVNTFAMLLRLTSAAPPPAWQAWLTAGVGLVAAAGAIWCAAKVYRIGLLMFGKPPDFATLVRWVRAA